MNPLCKTCALEGKCDSNRPDSIECNLENENAKYKIKVEHIPWNIILADALETSHSRPEAYIVVDFLRSLERRIEELEANS